MSEISRTISFKGLHKLQEIWLGKFHKGEKYAGGNAEAWFNCVLDFLSARGDEIIPRAVREQEERLINLGRSQEYLAALARIVDCPPSYNEYDRTLLVLTATPADRIQALKEVLT